MEILGDRSLVPKGKFIHPQPNVFTHRLKRASLFYFSEGDEEISHDGRFKEGAKVTLLKYDGGDYCWVVDEHGIYVRIEYQALLTA